MQNDDFHKNSISITEFNNKDVKGDDDFDSWISDSTITCTSDTSTSASTFTLGNAYTITTDASSTKKIQNLKYSMPIDLLYKWFPQEVKEYEENDDQVPF